MSQRLLLRPFINGIRKPYGTSQTGFPSVLSDPNPFVAFFFLGGGGKAGCRTATTPLIARRSYVTELKLGKDIAPKNYRRADGSFEPCDEILFLAIVGYREDLKVPPPSNASPPLSLNPSQSPRL